eukprot:75398_1
MAIFSNVECIQLADVFLQLPYSQIGSYASKLKQVCSNVKGLSTIGGNVDISNALFNIFGNDLHFLVHSHNANRFMDFSNINFSKLKQLKLRGSNTKTVNDIL